MSEAIHEALTEAISDMEGEPVLVGSFVLAAEVVHPDGSTTTAEYRSPGMSAATAFGMAYGLARTWEPQPGWAYEPDGD